MENSTERKWKGTIGQIKKYRRYGSIEVFSGKNPIEKEKRIAEMYNGDLLTNPTIDEAELNADLLVDALTTIQKCDLMPSELLEQNKRLIKCLENMLNPIGYMQKLAKSEGASLNGAMAVQLAESPQFYKDLAKELIQKIKGHE